MINTTVQKLKIQQNPLVYEEKSDTRRKVVIVKGTLIENFISRTIFDKFWYMLYYCRPNMDLYKKLY